MPGTWDQSTYLNNPLNSIPFPTPPNMGAGLWDGSPQRLKFSSTGVAAPIVSQAEWSSPLFDLQPWLRSAQNSNGQGQPIWRSGQGAGGKLWIQAYNMGPVLVGILPFGQLTDLRVTAFEFVSVNNAQVIVPITPSAGIDITSSIVSQESAILPFYPTGDGYPIRYWRVKLVWQYLTVPGNQGSPNFTSPITINASYY